MNKRTPKNSVKSTEKKPVRSKRKAQSAKGKVLSKGQALPKAKLTSAKAKASTKAVVKRKSIKQVLPQKAKKLVGKKADSFKLINRELSWLSFNSRVLEEAGDETVPLLERLKFLGIFSSNLDEFFRVRVAVVRRLLQIKKRNPGFDRKQVKKLLDEIMDHVVMQQDVFDSIYQNELQPALAEQGIYILDDEALSDEQRSHVRTYFVDEVARRLFPLILEEGREVPVLRDGSIYLAVRMSNSETGLVKFALVALPTKLISRFYILPAESNKIEIVLLDDVIRVSLDILFSSLDYDEFTAHTIKLTRDAELDMDNDVAQTLAEKIGKSLQQRKTGVPTRFIYDEQIPDDLLSFLIRKLKIDKDSVIAGGKYHNFRDFIKFPKVGDRSLRYTPETKVQLPVLDKAKSILDVVEKQDILLTYPFHSFDYLIRMLREAAIDPTVYAIKISLYRVAENSAVANALINAIKNGKQVTVLMELRARFMEEHNIYWANKLREEGAHVLHGIPGFKVHSKIILISRRNNFYSSHIAHVGTGNFNEETANLYSDISLLTTRKKVTAEVMKVFDMLQQFKPERFQFSTLWVSPIGTRSKFLELLAREVEFAKKGKFARVIVKVNNLVDETCCKAIYAAAKSGVQIDLIVRGICTLALDADEPNIRAVSIIDKYLEHARIFYFENGGKSEVFIGSADLMMRNLDVRVEVTCPVQDKSLKKLLKEILECQLSDNIKARLLESGMRNDYVRSGNKAIRSQVDTYRILRKFSE